MEELSQGSTLKSGKYKIVKVLGQGSFGITYLAQTRTSLDGQLGKMEVNASVTIKEFFMSDLNSRSSDGTHVERTSSTLVKNYLNKFRREAENLAKLHHPNIVKVSDVFDENNTTYYVMEYVDGETIDEYINSKGHLSEHESLKITQDVCAALSYMHEHKMLHLDLKPKNIMRNSEGQIFLIDFGLAKQYTEDGEPESSTSLGLGTPGYAPIEQAHYKKDGSFPVTLDIYALGASLYKMLTGKTPPESSYVLNEGLPLSQLQNVGISERTITIVEKAMAPMKKERYQSVKALSLVIGNSYEGKGIAAIQEEGTCYDDQIESATDIISSIDDEDIDERSFFEKNWKYGVVLVILICCSYFCFNWKNSSTTALPGIASESVIDSVDSVVKESTEQQSISIQSQMRQTRKEGKQKEVMEETASAAKGKEPSPAKSSVEEPAFFGGTSRLYAYLHENIKYPVVAEEKGIQGMVKVTFMVEKDGTITEIEVVKSVDPLLDKEAVRVIRSMPKWKPGKKNGSTVRMKCTIPISFRLQ